MAKEKEIIIPKLELKSFQVSIKNMENSSLLMNRFAEGAAKSIEDSQTGKGTMKKAAMNVEEEFKDSMYKTPDGKLGIEAKAIKASMVNAAVIANLKMTDMRKAFQIMGDVIPFTKHSKSVLRKDFLNNPNTGGKNLRIRAEIKEWELKVTIAHNPNYVSASQLINLLSLAGFHCGLLDYRPASKKCSGNHGLFKVKTK